MIRRFMLNSALCALGFMLVILLNFAFAQQENALPPGPARLHGTILFKNVPCEAATIIFFYTRDGKAQNAIFKSSTEGRFTVYVFDDVQAPLIVFFVSNKLRLIFEPSDFIPGNNYFRIFDINNAQKVKLKSKKYRKLFRNIKI